MGVRLVSFWLINLIGRSDVKGAFSRFNEFMLMAAAFMREGLPRFDALEKAGGYKYRGKGRGSYSKQIRSGKSFLAIGAKQAERYRKQGLRNVDVNGFSLIQRG